MLLNLTDLLLLSSVIWLPLFLLSLLEQFLVRLLGKKLLSSLELWCHSLLKLNDSLRE
jgi:hypothetical protein